MGDSEGCGNDLGRQRKAYKTYVFGHFPGGIVETQQFDILIFRANFSTGEKSMPIRNETSVAVKGVLTSSDEFFRLPTPGTTRTLRPRSRYPQTLA